MPYRPLTLLFCLTLVASCAAPIVPRTLYSQTMDDLSKNSGTGGLRAASLERQERRIKRVRAAFEQGEFETKDDFFWSAALLATSDKTDDLELSHELALLAAELGEDKAFRIAAEATDLLHLKRGEPQRFGTQVVYDPFGKTWQLYPTDPRTTDAERAAHGVAPMAELLARARGLNAETEALAPFVKLPSETE